jgi:hypothetical protein
MRNKITGSSVLDTYIHHSEKAETRKPLKAHIFFKDKDFLQTWLEVPPT